MPGESLRQEATALLAQTSDAVRKISPKGVLELRTPDAFVVPMYWRAVRLFDAIAILLEKNLPEEAVMLGRSLFVDGLHLAELEQAGAQRTALVLGWANTSIEEKKGLIKEASRLGLEVDLDTLLARLEEERTKLHRYARRHGVGPFRKFLSERVAAVKFGRVHDYWTYMLAHEFVHGTDAAFMFNRAKVSAHTIAIHDRTSDSQILVGAACLAAMSVLQAAIAGANIFG